MSAHSMLTPFSPSGILSGSGQLLRGVNREAIVRYVRQMPGISRTGLAERAGLSKATISELVAGLITEGWLTESEFTGKRTAGRVPRPLGLDGTRRRLLGCQITCDRSVLVATTLAGEVTELSVCNTSDRTPAAAFAALSAQIGEVYQKLARRGIFVSGIGLSAPGPVHPATGMLLFSDSAGWENLPVQKMLTECLDGLGLPAIPTLVSRGVNCVAQYHFETEQVFEEEPLLYVHIGKGIAASILVDGVPLIGMNGLTGAIAHLVTEHDGAQCDCGKRGCANTSVTLGAMERSLGIDGHELQRSYRAGDARVVQHVEETARKLAVVIHGLCLAYDPARIFVGGHALKLGAKFQAVLRDQLALLASGVGRQFPGIKAVRYDAYDGARGAAMLMLRSSLSGSTSAEQEACIADMRVDCLEPVLAE